MLKRILLIWVLIVSSFWFYTSVPLVSAEDKPSDNCVQLNTDIPWINKKQICEGDAGNVFWNIMWGLMKLFINFVVAVAFIALIASGVMMMFSGVSQSTAGKWKELLKKVVIWIILLGLSGIILHTLNPNFFK